MLTKETPPSGQDGRNYLEQPLFSPRPKDSMHHRCEIVSRFKKESTVSVNVKNSLEERERWSEWTVIEVEKLVLNV
jgi:hypothetical protein